MNSDDIRELVYILLGTVVFCGIVIVGISLAIYDPKLDGGAVNLVGQAGDGTKLYEQSVGRQRVFFSRSGTSWTTEESCGKGCVRAVPHSVPSNNGTAQ